MSATTPEPFASGITFGEVERVGTPTRELERYLLSHDAVFPPLLETGKWYKTAKRPRFTKSGQEPNGIKLSPKQSRNREVVGLQVSDFTIASPFGFS